MSTEVFQNQAMACLAKSGEVGNDSSGPAMPMAWTPESGPSHTSMKFDPTDTEEKLAISNTQISSKEDLNQNYPDNQSKITMTNGLQEAPTSPSSPPSSKKLNGHHHSPPVAADTPLVNITSRELPRADDMSSSAPQESTENTNQQKAYSPPQPQVSDEDASSSSSSDHEISVGVETDESYASDIESTAIDIPR